MIEWLKMGGYGFFVWGSYGMLAVAIIIELMLLRRHRERARQQVLDAIEEDTQ
jgi:heme exporter protein D